MDQYKIYIKRQLKITIILFTEILRNQHVLQQSMLAMMTDLNKIKAALLKTNLQETEDIFEPKRAKTEEEFLAFCEGISGDSSKRDLFVSDL